MITWIILKIDNVNFEYAFKFYVNMYFRKIPSVTIQNIHLFMLSHVIHACNTCVNTKREGWDKFGKMANLDYDALPTPWKTQMW
jgi:hypothetical protein